MSDQVATALVQPSETKPTRAEKFARVKMAFGLEADPSGKPPYIWAERANAPIFALIVLIGLPLLGWSGLVRSGR